MVVYIATANEHKKEELQRQIAGHAGLANKLEIKTLADLPASVNSRFQPKETGETFSENALIKARALYDLISSPVIADDSGLEVEALGNRPGVHSARYAPTDKEKIKKLLGELENFPDSKQRKARFVSSICFLDEDGHEVYFNGRVEGNIADAPSGKEGFGYDPVFFYPPQNRTFAELTPAEKESVSHRGRAVTLFLEYLERWLNLHGA